MLAQKKFILAGVTLLFTIGLFAVGGVALAQTETPTLRLYGSENQGAGNPQVTDPASNQQPEDSPYTGVEGVNSIFDPQGPQAPRQDAMTWNPAWLYEYETLDENQQGGLYHQLYSDDVNISEKVWFRLWYEPAHQDITATVGNVLTTTYPAIMQEFTYLLMEAPGYAALNDSFPAQPISGTAGQTQFVFPIGIHTSTWASPFGYGVTTFDIDFDGQNDDAVRIHSEKTLAALTGIHADFDGDNQLDDLDVDSTMNGNEEVVFVIDEVTLTRQGWTPQAGTHDPTAPVSAFAMFLDHMVELVNVTPNGMAQLQIWHTGGGLEGDPVITPPSGEVQPDPVPHRLGAVLPYPARSMGIVGRNKVNVTQIQPNGNNLGQLDGGWFVFVRDINPATETVSLAIGRALGATHSALYTGDGRHDLQPGDPGYLKHWFVDGHEYMLSALRMLPIVNAAGATEYGFASITIRTVVPSLDVAKANESQLLQGYVVSQTTSQPLSLLPPFNMPNHTIAEAISDTVALPGTSGATYPCRPSLDIHWVAAGSEASFAGELAEVLTADVATQQIEPLKLFWENQTFQTLPDHYARIRLPQGVRYLVTSPWRTQTGERVEFWYTPTQMHDLYINTTYTSLPQPPLPPVTQPPIHIVRYGETLSQIAARYRVSLKALMKVNRLSNPNLVRVGERLVIPR